MKRSKWYWSVAPLWKIELLSVLYWVMWAFICSLQVCIVKCCNTCMMQFIIHGSSNSSAFSSLGNISQLYCCCENADHSSTHSSRKSIYKIVPFVWQMLALSLRVQKQEYNSLIIASFRQITHFGFCSCAKEPLIFHPNGE